MKKYFVFVFFIFGCNSNRFFIKSSVVLDKNNDLECSIKIKNLTKDTLVLSANLNVLPKDKDSSNAYLELYQKNGNILNNIKSDDFDYTLIPLEFYFDENELSLNLQPAQTHEYHLNVSSFFRRLKKGRYLLRICFKPEFNRDRYICTTSNFRLKKDYIFPLVQ